MVADNTDFGRDYQAYPYGSYDQADSRQLLFPLQGSIDGRRPPKERVLGVPDGTGGVVFPFDALDALGEVAVVDGATSAGSFVVIWERRNGGAMAFRPELDGVPVTLQVVDGRIVDAETGSQWRLDGVALGGPLAGRRLEPVAEAFVAFWFAFPAFYPDLELWTGR